MNSFVALAFFLLALSLPRDGMPITNTFSVARGTSSSASKASSSVVSSGSLFDVVEPVKMSFPPMNKTILSYCLFSGKNSDRCRICAPGSDRMLKFGNKDKRELLNSLISNYEGFSRGVTEIYSYLNVSLTSNVLLTFFLFFAYILINFYEKKDKIVTVVLLALHIRIKGVAEFSDFKLLRFFPKSYRGL